MREIEINKKNEDKDTNYICMLTQLIEGIKGGKICLLT